MKKNKVIELVGGPADGEIYSVPESDEQLAVRPRIKEPIYYYRQTEARPNSPLADQVFEYDKKRTEEAK